MIVVQPIESREWQLYRDLRLRALRDSPEAFASTYESEAARTDEAWAMRIATAVASDNDHPCFAYHDGVVCGLVWCKLSGSEQGVADIFQMWVDPGSRGLGGGHALLVHAVSWAKNLDMQRLRLGTTALDSPAMRLYLNCGFLPVGMLEPLRDHSDLKSQSMELEIQHQSAHH